MRPRFFAPSLDTARDEAVLPEDESRHLTRVLRLKPGAEIEIFDGLGHEFVAVVQHADRARVTVRLDRPLAAAGEPRVPVRLAQAVLKPAQMDDVVRDATMLGVHAIVPLITAHVAAPVRGPWARATERWRRVALASAKQCRRSTLPAISEPVSFDVWLEQEVAGRGPDPTLVLIEPSTQTPGRTLRSLTADPAPRTVRLTVGPEGGWSEAEVARAARSGCTLITLGALTLRADAAAVVAMSGLAVVWSS
jgi:16S rRNA (uracil1498-N3)-methyltransferase